MSALWDSNQTLEQKKVSAVRSTNSKSNASSKPQRLMKRISSPAMRRSIISPSSKISPPTDATPRLTQASLSHLPHAHASIQDWRKCSEPSLIDQNNNGYRPRATSVDNWVDGSTSPVQTRIRSKSSQSAQLLENISQKLDKQSLESSLMSQGTLLAVVTKTDAATDTPNISRVNKNPLLAHSIEGSTKSAPQYDICGETFESRYPWMKDVAIQCEITESSQRAVDKMKKYRSYCSGVICHNGGKKSHFVKRYSSVGSQSCHSAAYENNTFSKESELCESEEERKVMERYAGGRRPCIISNLNLGPEDDEQNDSTEHDEVKLNVDSVLMSQHSKQSSSAGGQSSTRLRGSAAYDCDSISLTDQNDKIKSQKNRTFFNKIKTPRKNVPEALDYYLRNELRNSEFKDERISSYRHTHWRELMVSQEVETAEICDRELKRLNAVWELFTTECVFLVDHLMVLKHVFLEPLKKCQVEGLLMNVEPFKLFGNIDELCHISYKFCREFANPFKLMTSPRCFGSTDHLVSCLDKMTLNSRDGETYHSYLLNYKSALSYLQTLRNTVEEISVYEKFCGSDPRCNRLQLTDLLIAPMHHWTRLPLVLERIKHHTTGVDDITKLTECINNVENSLKSLEDKMKWLKTFERVREIEKQLVWPSVLDTDQKLFIPESLKPVITVHQHEETLADQIREVIYEGQLILTEKDKNHEIYSFLFSDFILLTKLKKDHRKNKITKHLEKSSEGYYHIIKHPIPIETVNVYNITTVEASQTNMKNAFAITQSDKFQRVIAVYTFQAHTSFGKDSWIKCISEATEKSESGTEREQPEKTASFKKLLNSDNSANLMANAKVLEIVSSTMDRRSQHAVAKRSKLLKKANTSYELLRNKTCIEKNKLHFKQHSDSAMLPEESLGSRYRSRSIDELNRQISTESNDSSDETNQSEDRDAF